MASYPVQAVDPNVDYLLFGFGFQSLLFRLMKASSSVFHALCFGSLTTAFLSCVAMKAC